MKKLVFLSFLWLHGLVLNAQQVFKAEELQVLWELHENNHQDKAQFLASFKFVNQSKRNIDLSSSTVYFSYPRVVTLVTSKNASFENISGEFCRILFNENVKLVEPKDTLTVSYIANGKSKNYTDAPSGLYLTFNHEPAKSYSLTNFKKNVIPGKESAQLKLSPSVVFEKNKMTSTIPIEQLQPILPSPISYQSASGAFKITTSTVLHFDPSFIQEATLFNQEMALLLGKFLPLAGKVEQAIVLKKIVGMAPEAYQLSVTERGIVISASENAGLFYGLQSLKMMMPPTSWGSKQKEIRVPAAIVSDAPRFGYRSFMLDVARNFQTKEQVLKIIDLLALYKINTLHFHLNDDEGWRLEIPSLPELVEVGAKRGHLLPLHPSYGSGAKPNSFPGSGYYTKADFIELLKYAKVRHIQVIPEIETPGHARAAIKAMDARYERLKKQGDLAAARQYLLRDTLDGSTYRSVQGYKDNVMNIALPSTYAFIEKVVEEVQEMYALAQAPLKTIHIGGDEVPAGVWEKSPAVAQLMKSEQIARVDDLWYYYLGKANQLLTKKGLYLSGWEEVAMRKTKLDGKTRYIANPDFTNQNFNAYVWNNVWGWGSEDLAYRLANAGYKVVLSPVTNFYFDLAYEADADEPGLYWGSFVDVDKPFYFSPLDYYRSAKEDPLGNPIDPSIFVGKERLTDYGASNIVGVQSQIWSEKIRGPKELEYMLLPKLLGFAERAWAKDPVWTADIDSKAYRKDWDWFANVLAKREFVRLDTYAGGFNYRIPTAGLRLIEGAVEANVQFPGLTIRYTSDGSEPSLKSKIYTSAITDKGLLRFKVFNVSGRGGRVVSIVNP